MVDLFHFLTNLLFFGVSLLYYYTSLNSSIICCLYSGDGYLFNVKLNSSIIYLFGTNLNSSIICFLSSGDMYLFLGVVIFTSSSFVSSLLCDSFVDFFLETLVILSAILLPIKSPVASAIFWIALFDSVFISSVVDF